MTYCSVNRVRLVSGLESEKVSDSDLRDLRDDIATPELNQDVNQKVQDQRVDVQLSGEKENDIDGSNKTFYLQRTHNSELQVADSNDDGVVDASDVTVYQIDLDDNRVTNLNVTLQDKDIGKLEIEQNSGDALEEGQLYATYNVSPVDEDGYGTDFSGAGPDRLIETACAQLTAHYAFTNVDASKLEDFDIGNISINEQSGGAEEMMKAYRQTVRRINQTQLSQSGPNQNSVSGAFTNVR